MLKNSLGVVHKRRNVIFENFDTLLLVWSQKFLPIKAVTSFMANPYCQFQQYLRSAFSYKIFFEKLFCTYNLGLNFIA